VIDVNSAGGNLVLGGMEISQSPEGQTRNNYLAAFDREGQETARYFERSYSWVWASLELNEADQEFPHFRRWDVGPDGRVYAATERNRYVVEVYRPDGAVDRIIERAFESRRRDENEMRVVNEVQQATRNRFPAQMQIKIQVEDTEPDIRSLHVTQDGRLMVTSSRGYRDQPAGIMTTLDVFDAEGNFDRQVAVACEGDGELDGLFFASDDRVVRVTGFRSALIGLQTNGAVSLEGEDAEPAPMEVVYYAVER
jgi:hypothetical protein